MPFDTVSHPEAARSSKRTTSIAEMIAIGKLFYERNWVMGTSGNFSVVLEEKPIELLITASGKHKGRLTAEDFLQLSESGEIIPGAMRPSAEVRIHQAILGERKAGAILHTHSVWATLLSGFHTSSDGILIEGYEMLKGLSGVTTHEHREWLPILENSQDYIALSAQISELLKKSPEIHGIVLRRHGLYTWGKDIAEALRHVEILEFLFEVLGRKLEIDGQRNTSPQSR